MLIVVRRDKSRGYQWTDSGSTATKPTAGRTAEADFSEPFRLRLHNALMVLACALPACDRAQEIAVSQRLPQALSKLLRFAARHSNSAALSGGTASMLQHLAGAGRARGQWSPSNGQLAAWIYALCCAFSFECERNKQLLADSGENHAAVAGGGGGNTLHHLATHGMHKGTHTPVRWLSLALVTSLATDMSQIGNSPSLRNTLAVTVATAVQRSTHSTLLDPEAVVHLLDCLTALIGPCRDRPVGGSGPSAFYSATAGRGSAVADSELKLAPFPDLVRWVYDEHKQRPEVVRALCRSLGVVSSTAGGGDNKRALSMLSDSLLRMLCAEYTGSTHAVVATTAAVSLWSVVHSSEKAKAIVKNALAELGEVPTLEAAGFSAVDENIVSKARTMIAALVVT